MARPQKKPGQRRKKTTEVDALQLRYARETNTTSQSQALWALFVIIVMGLMGLYQSRSVEQEAPSVEQRVTADEGFIHSLLNGESRNPSQSYKSR